MLSLQLIQMLFMCTTKPCKESNVTKEWRQMMLLYPIMLALVLLWCIYFWGFLPFFLSLKKHTHKNFVMILKCQSSLFVFGLTQELTVKHKWNPWKRFTITPKIVFQNLIDLGFNNNKIEVHKAINSYLKFVNV